MQGNLKNSILLLKDKAIFVKAPLLATVPASESITALNPRIVSLEPFSPTTRTGLEDVCPPITKPALLV